MCGDSQPGGHVQTTRIVCPAHSLVAGSSVHSSHLRKQSRDCSLPRHKKKS